MRDEWEMKKFGDICKYDKQQDHFIDLPYVGLEDIESDTTKFLGTLSPTTVKSKTFRFDTSHVLYGRLRPYLNKVLVPNFEGHCSTEIFPVLPSDELDRNYLKYWFISDSTVRKIDSTSTGARMPRANMKEVKDFKIPIPPLPEQKRIVAILDEVFEAIDHAKTNVERNIENAEELFQSKLNEIFSQRGEGWKEKPIEKITTVINGYAFKSNNFSPENSVKAIKITNVGVQEFVEDTENNLPKDFLDTYYKVKVSRGDIVIALTRTIISSGLKVARVPESYDDALVNQRVAALSPIKEVVNPTYLYYFLSTDIVSDYVLSNVNTLMQPNLSIRDLRKLKVPICSILKQKEITFVIDSLWDKVSSIIEAYQSELKNIEELKKSILQKAFLGELTANEHVAA